MNDFLPVGLTATAISGSGWTCTVSPLACQRNDTLPVGGFWAPITLTVNVDPAAPASLTNTATVSGGGDTNPSNNTAIDTVTILTLPDLTITKTHPADFYQGQVGGIFNITVSNVGTSATSAPATVVDTLPNGLTATAISGPGWTCTLATVTCTRSDSLAGLGVYPTITVTVNVATNANQTLLNKAVVSGGGEVNLTNDIATDIVQVRPQPDLTITKTHTGNFQLGQIGATFTITASNVGLGYTTAPVTVTDVLPNGLTATAIAGAGWTCTLASLSCARADSIGINAAYPPITLTVNVSPTAPPTMVNTATVAGGGETNLTNDTATDTVMVIQPDMTITKSHTGDFTRGQQGATFTLTATNVGMGNTAGTVIVTDTLPAGLTASAISGNGWTCFLASLNCSRSDVLPPNGSYPPITVTVNVDPMAPAMVTNTAVVAGGGEKNLANDTATDPVNILIPDMTITLSHVGNFQRGQIGAMFTIGTSNVGKAPTLGTVTVTDALPAGLTATAIGGNGWTCTLSPLSCTRNDVLGIGQAYPPITLTVNVDPMAPIMMTDMAVVGGGGEVNLANDTANDPVMLDLPDMTITKTHTGSFALGGTGNFTLTASNVGVAPTIGAVTVTDALPAGMTATAISGTGWACTLSPLSCTRSDVLAPAALYPPIALTVSISPTAATTLTNTAVVTGGGETNTANDTATDTVVLNQPDLTISKSHTGTFSAGQSGSYTITVSNVGQGPSVGAANVADTLPAGLTATAISGTGWTCTLSPLNCSRQDVLAAGAAWPPITVSVNIAATATGTVVNTAVVSGGGDSNPNNNTATDPAVISQAPDLTITKSHTGNFNRGQTGSYTITVVNVGQSPSVGTVTVVDTIPTGLILNSISGTGWTCVTNTATCTRSDALAANASYPVISVGVGITANAPNNVVNTAVVSGGNDSNPNNNTATDPTPINGVSPQLTVVKTHSGDFSRGGTGVYTLVVSNIGTAPSQGLVSLMDDLPVGLTVTSFSGQGWACDIPTLTCTRSDSLAPTASFPPVYLLVGVLPNAPNDIVNLATVSGGGSPPAYSGGTAATTGVDTLIVAPVSPTFTITKVADKQFADAGDVITYRVDIANNNPTAIQNATVQDKLPVGFMYVAATARLILGTAAPVPIDAGPVPGALIFNLGTMQPNSTATVIYRVQITARAPGGAGVNDARARGNFPNGTPIATNLGSARVIVGSGLLSVQQFIIGRIFEDKNGNGLYDKDERPLAGVRVYLSNGQSASTDANGMYNIPSVNPGAVTISIDRATIPPGYTLADSKRKDFESWTRLLRTPLGSGAMLRQNFALVRLPDAAEQAPVTTPAAAISAERILPSAVPPPAMTQGSGKPGDLKVTVEASQPTLPADGRTSMSVRVRVTGPDGTPVPQKEIRIRTSLGEFVATEGLTPMVPSKAAAGMPQSTPSPSAQNMGSLLNPPTSPAPIFGVNTQAQLGRTADQVPERMQVATALLTKGEATFLLMAPNNSGTAKIEAETGDLEHLVSGTTEVFFTPEKRGPILVGLGELAFGHAAPDFWLFGQTGDVARRLDAFMQAPWGGALITLGYTSHLAINNLNGVNQMFQQDPLDRVYPVYGDSSTQYRAAQANSHLYARVEKDHSYAVFGDLHGDKTQQASTGIGDFNRNVTGVEVHLEDSKKNAITLMGARPNTSYARDSYPASTLGMLQLSHTDIIPGSESVALEVRDRYNPEILISREPLMRSADYNLDWVSGVVFFLRSLNAFDQSLNLQQVVISYEYRTVGLSSSLYGVRTATSFNGTGTKIALSATNQRTSGQGSYYLMGMELWQKLPLNGKLHVELPVSYGDGFVAGVSNSISTGTTTQPAEVNGMALRADLDQPLPFMEAKVEAAVSKTQATFLNPWGATTLPGSQTIRTAFSFTPVPGARLKTGFMDEENKTSLVNNNRITALVEWKQRINQFVALTFGYDFRDLNDNLLKMNRQSTMFNGIIEWKPTAKFRASVRRDQNLEEADPTYPNQWLLNANYLVSDTVRLFLTQRFSSAPIVPIGDYSRTGFAATAGKTETAIGIEDRWNKYASIQGRYEIENGINGTDSFAVIGLVNRIPVADHFSVDLGMERGLLISGPDGSFESGSVGFSWLPNNHFRASSRYELREQNGFGQIFTAGAAGRISDSLTLLGTIQHVDAGFSTLPGTPSLFGAQQSNVTQGSVAFAIRPAHNDRTGILFSYTHRSADLTNTTADQPEHDTVDILQTDGYWQATRRLEFYGKFAMSNREYSYGPGSDVKTLTYLWQGRAQSKIWRRFDGAIEGRILNQPDYNVSRAIVGVELGAWALRDLRFAVGWNFKSADEIQAEFLTAPIHHGFYFVLTTKLSNLFDLFGSPQKK